MTVCAWSNPRLLLGQLNIGTYDTQTLRDNGGEQSKAQAIEEQFHAGGFVCGCVGLQETTSKATGDSSTCRHPVFALAADETGQRRL